MQGEDMTRGRRLTRHLKYLRGRADCGRAIDANELIQGRQRRRKLRGRRPAADERKEWMSSTRVGAVVESGPTLELERRLAHLPARSAVDFGTLAEHLDERVDTALQLFLRPVFPARSDEILPSDMIVRMQADFEAVRADARQLGHAPAA